jgi:hypothetical protein
MNQAPNVLDRAHAAGLTIVLSGRDRLRIVGPPAALTSELRNELAANKNALLAYLTPYPCARCGRPLVPVPGLACVECSAGTLEPHEANR